ncbi:gliding motility-associated C-terminal domain-containing protein [Flavihumibacter sp.]|uniref:gliding motility-associated C-terminal domain-containing protein n=1 Tax=Flavihumibacter sp. TaxID=1913981 RepID=UPI002FC7D3F4
MRVGMVSMLILAITVSNGYAQAPAMEWLRCYGSNYDDEPREVKATTDGGYIMTGSVGHSSNDVSAHFLESSPDIWVVKINAIGAIEWEITLGDQQYQFAASVVETPDGGFVVGGTTYSTSICLLGDNSSNILLVKLSSSGEFLWEKKYGGSGNEFLSELDLLPDGGFLLTGHSTSSDGDLTKNNGAEDFWIVKTDANWNIIWQQSFGGSRTDQAVSAAVAPGGGFFIVGSSESTDFDFGLNYGDSDFLLLHLSENGELRWQKKFGGSNHDFAWAVCATQDGGAIMAGMTNSRDGDLSRPTSAPDDIDIWVVRVDATGNLVWQKSFGGPQDEIAFDMTPAMDGGFLLCGKTGLSNNSAPCTNGDTDIWVIRINGSGEMVWQKALGGEGHDYGSSIVENKDGSIMVAGITCSAGLPNYHSARPTGECLDMLLVKLSPTGGPVPVPSLKISPELVCSGSPVWLSATVINVGSHPRYEWKRNGQVVGSEATYGASDFTAGDQISCTVTPGGICDKGQAVVTASITLKTKPDLPLPVLSIDGPELICPCSPALYRAIVENAGPAPRYQWFVNDMLVAIGGTEYLHREAQNGDRVHYRLLDASGCLPGGFVESAGIVVTVAGQEAVAQIEGQAGAVCEGERVAFRALISGSADTGSSRWLVNGVLAASGTALYETDSLHDGDKVSFMINAHTECGGGGDLFSNEILVMVRPAGGRLLISANSSSVCRGAEMVFRAEAENGGSVAAVQWLVNGVAVAGATGSEWRTAGLSDGDIVSCEWAGGDFCLGAGSGSEGINVRVYEPPLLTLYPTDTILNRGSSLQLRAQVSGEVSVLAWEPADKLLDPQSLNPVSVNLDKDIVFTLRIEDVNGCQAMTTARITVMGELFFPNAFSPNGDGKNDLFRGIFPGTPQHFELRIYNRIGQEVFATNDISKGWDGKLGGRPQGSQTYVWRCTYSQRGEPARKQQGTVLLVR